MTLTEFYVLTVAVTEPIHGYAIMQRVRTASLGEVDIVPGTLYRTLARLQKTGLLEPHAVEGDARRRGYQTTRDGVQALQDQVDIMDQAVAFAMGTGYFFT